MKNIYLILIGLVMQNALSQEATTIYLIRHAEKADASANPELSEAGKIRAQNWADYFSQITIDAVYSTNYNRTLQTGLPIAESKEKEIILYNPSTLNLEILVSENNGKTLLIIGHSNTVPKQINALLKQNKYPDMLESEFGNLYKITVTRDAVETTLIIP